MARLYHLTGHELGDGTFFSTPSYTTYKGRTLVAIQAWKAGQPYTIIPGYQVGEIRRTGFGTPFIEIEKIPKQEQQAIRDFLLGFKFEGPINFSEERKSNEMATE